jgi:hypothetical protein
MNCRVIALALFLGFTSATAWSAHWPSWRGPNQDNTTAERGFPTKWTRQQNVKWRAELPEAGNSSPIVWGDTVFVTQALEDGKQRTLLALERSTGKVRWQEGVRYPEQEPRH